MMIVRIINHTLPAIKKQVFLESRMHAQMCTMDIQNRLYYREFINNICVTVIFKELYIVIKKHCKKSLSTI